MSYPNPGSDAAAREGCRCDRFRNQYGRGKPGTTDFGGTAQFEVDRLCRVHGDGTGWHPGRVRAPEPDVPVHDLAVRGARKDFEARNAKYLPKTKAEVGICPRCGNTRKISPTYGVCIATCAAVVRERRRAGDRKEAA